METTGFFLLQYLNDIVMNQKPFVKPRAEEGNGDVWLLKMKNNSRTTVWFFGENRNLYSLISQSEHLLLKAIYSWPNWHGKWLNSFLNDKSNQSSNIEWTKRPFLMRLIPPNKQNKAKINGTNTANFKQKSMNEWNYETQKLKCRWSCNFRLGTRNKRTKSRSHEWMTLVWTPKQSVSRPVEKFTRLISNLKIFFCLFWFPLLVPLVVGWSPASVCWSAGPMVRCSVCSMAGCLV